MATIRPSAVSTSASEMPAETAGAGGRDALERADDADDGAEQTDERRDRAHRGEHAHAAPKLLADRFFLTLGLASCELDAREVLLLGRRELAQDRGDQARERRRLVTVGELRGLRVVEVRQERDYRAEELLRLALRANERDPALDDDGEAHGGHHEQERGDDLAPCGYNTSSIAAAREELHLRKSEVPQGIPMPFFIPAMTAAISSSMMLPKTSLGLTYSIQWAFT